MKTNHTDLEQLLRQDLETCVKEHDLLQIKSTGSVSGKIFYGKIQVEDGGKLIGEINYRDKEHKQEEFKDWKAL